MSDRSGIFEGSDPFEIARRWLKEAEQSEINDPNAMSVATVDANGLPNVRVVLLKDIEDDAFVFYTNQESAKGQELAATQKAAFVIHWKSLRRQIRVRGNVELQSDEKADAYYASRSLKSRLGAWASDQSRPLDRRETLEKKLQEATNRYGNNPPRPPYWGGYRIVPEQIEFWSDGAHRLHDRHMFTRNAVASGWNIIRLSP